MSERTVYNPSRFLTHETRHKILSCVPTLNDYAANIENKLRVRGENELADRMLEEIRMSLEEKSSH